MKPKTLYPFAIVILYCEVCENLIVAYVEFDGEFPKMIHCTNCQSDLELHFPQAARLVNAQDGK